jgi:hypothetical protein
LEGSNAALSVRDIVKKTGTERCVVLVIDAKRKKVSDAEIIQDLCSHGIPQQEASALIESTVAGFRAGVAAVVTGGPSRKACTPRADPFYDLAFRKGRAAMRFTAPFWVIAKFLLPFLIGAALVGVIVWQCLR